MKIDVIDIYKAEYKSAYLVSHEKGDKRKRVYLIGFDGSRKGMLYARYVWEKHNNRMLPDGFTIDHIDEDKTNDSIENLQILSLSDNMMKNIDFRTKKGKLHVVLKMVCPICGVTFDFPKRNLSTHPNPCCSRSCGAKKGNMKSKKRKSQQDTL